MKLFFLSCAFILFFSLSYSQTISRDVISSAGSSGAGGGLQMSFTVGEAIIYTQTQNSNILTQGFQQPDDVCKAQAGTLSSNPLDEEDCIEPGNPNDIELSAVPNNDVVIPEGYSVIYLLSKDSPSVIISTSSTPAFMVNEPGAYRIHTLVFNADDSSPDFLDLSTIAPGQTLLSSLLERIAETPICASLDEEGALFDVRSCDCNVSAGTLTAEPLTDEDCLNPNDTDSVALTALTNGDAIIPTGYEQVFYLTLEQGGEEIILEENNTAEFTVDMIGTYHMYSLVFFPVQGDTNFLDLSFLELGSTTLQVFTERVSSQSVCISLDSEGASFTVRECMECDAEAGSLALISPGPDDCIDPVVQDDLVITAAPNGDEVIPQGYTVTYLLVSRGNNTILEISEEPQFTISNPGAYSVFPLVYNDNPGDDNFLDLSRFTIGTSTIGEINSFIANSEICADLADGGLNVDIELCECEAEISSLTPLELDPDCLNEQTQSLMIRAEILANIPQGFEELYFLSTDRNSPILALDQSPSFVVTQTGTFVISGLIYDPNTFNVDFIIPDQTSISDIEDAIAVQAVCLDLSENGAVFSITECPDETACERLEIPTIFTPGGNGFNDTWEIRNFSGLASIKVFDRWGSLMYEGPFPWNGSKDNNNSNIVPRGTYYYLLEIASTGEICKGAVTVIPDNP